MVEGCFIFLYPVTLDVGIESLLYIQVRPRKSSCLGQISILAMLCLTLEAAKRWMTVSRTVMCSSKVPEVEMKMSTQYDLTVGRSLRMMSMVCFKKKL